MKSFPLLAIEQFERLILSHNVEFRGGFYMKAKGVTGEVSEIYVPDTRQVFCNTCKALAILISPAFSKTMKPKYEEILKDLEELKKAFIKKSTVDETIVLGASYYEKYGKTSDIILLEEYNMNRVKKYQELFKELSAEFNRHKFWQTATTDD